MALQKQCYVCCCGMYPNDLLSSTAALFFVVCGLVSFYGVSQVVSALTSQLKPMSVAFVEEILVLQKEQSIYHDGMLASVMLTDKCRCEPLWLG